MPNPSQIAADEPEATTQTSVSPSSDDIEAAAKTIAAVTGQGLIAARRRARASSEARVEMLAACQTTGDFRPAIAEIYGTR